MQGPMFQEYSTEIDFYISDALPISILMQYGSTVGISHISYDRSR